MINGFDELKICEYCIDFKELLVCDAIKQRSININSIIEINGQKCLEIRLDDIVTIHPMITNRNEKLLKIIERLEKKNIIEVLKSEDGYIYISILDGFYNLLTSGTMRIALSKTKPDLKVILELYKELMKEKKLPGYKKMTDKRRKSMNARLREYGLDDVVLAIENASRSEYLINQIRAGSWYTFDWIFNQNNFIKILEQKYNRQINDPSVIAETLKSDEFETANKIVRF